MKKNLNNLATFILTSCKYVTNHEIINNELIICTKISNIYNLLDDLKKIDDLKFEMLLDITAVDYPQRSKRFELVYILLSLKNHLRIKVKIFLNDNEIVPSISNLYKSAGWYEREVWDMYGISFNGNNDLRRILTDYGFEGYPLRKDFPLTGFVELRYDEAKKKVEYSKVKLTQDYRNFDFLSPWEGGTLPGDEKADN
ncbi:MAG TPA: NADH-quinone oxidoreductase subunit C [Pelagibacterales bacterium]|jgi:NADH-quinone oxidoreductase subunit C|nr:NADH-quinone oxidoreductase subunit C [Pelagibacterales bacterium]